jgi:lipoyl(octanoyl) transferase
MTQRETKTATRECRVIPVGRIEYQAAWDWQRRLAADRSAGRCGDTLLLLEHPPTITLGRAADRSNILVASEELARRGVALVESDRGGDVTYHAPGQLVGYPILKLSRYGGGLLRYLRGLEETLIRVLASYGIAAGRVPDLTGVWVRTTDAADADDYDAKIAAIGVRLSASGITSHGFALNVAPDLRGFEQIIPCGIRQRRVTSLEYLLGSAPPLDEVAERVIAQFAEVFEARLLIEEQTWLNLSP